MKLTLFRASNGTFGFYIVNIVYKSQTFLFNHENMSISSPKHDMSRGKTYVLKRQTCVLKRQTYVLKPHTACLNANRNKLRHTFNTRRVLYQFRYVAYRYTRTFFPAEINFNIIYSVLYFYDRANDNYLKITFN